MAKNDAVSGSPGNRTGLPFAAIHFLSVFLSAFLLFLVQPLMSKALLPWFGGSSGVWTVCMLVFQCLLFLGYVYAHGLTTWLSPRWQGLVHGALLLAVVVGLRVLPGAVHRPVGSQDPLWQIVWVLLKTAAFPFFVLSTSGPLLQYWYALSSGGASPYRLYALSNGGSLAALFSYPLFFEPNFDLPTQAWIWAVLFVFFVGGKLVCASYASRSSAALGLLHGGSSNKTVEVNTVACSDMNKGKSAPAGWARNEDAMPSSEGATVAQPSPPSTMGSRLLWFVLAFTPSVMLLATTNQVCLDVASIPFLWIFPLALYLLTFILCFDSDKWYRRDVWITLVLLTSAGMTWALFLAEDASILLQVLAFFAGLFSCAMFCHGELASRKPAAKHLTGFYMILSAGGAAGGVFVSLIAPVVFNSFLELHIAIAATVYLAAWAAYRLQGKKDDAPHAASKDDKPPPVVPAWVLPAGTALYGALLTAVLAYETQHRQTGYLAGVRNFYGVLRVFENVSPNPVNNNRILIHGRITHGFQFRSAAKEMRGATYYAPYSGAGLAMRNHAVGRSRNLGVIGLGAGTLAAYATSKDHLRFFELDPDVERIAREYFTFLSRTPAKVDVVLGDARVSLENEAAAGTEAPYDVLVVDAFSGDAIPMHLLTSEAMEIYLKRLTPDGLLAMHISNRHFDLQPVLKSLASTAGLHAGLIFSAGNDDSGTTPSSWVLMSRQEASLKQPYFQGLKGLGDKPPVAWTDQRGNLLSVLRILGADQAEDDLGNRFYSHLTLARRAVEMKNAVEAANQAQAALNIDPHSSSAWLVLGNAARQMGDREKAIAYYQRSAEFDEDTAFEAMNNWGALISASDPAQALTLFDRSLAINANFVDAYVNKGNALARLQRFDEAISCYRKALAMEPTKQDAAKNLQVVESMKAEAAQSSRP